MSDVIVIGVGVSELVAAAYLKRAGHSVTVLDERGTADAAPLADMGWIPDALVSDLDLKRHGFQVEHAEAFPTALTESEKHWRSFCERMARLARLLESIYCAPPPDPLTETFAGYWDLAKVALRMRGLKREGLEDLLRLLPMSAADFLNDSLEGEALKGALGAISVRDLAQGPRSGGTAFNLLHHHVGNAPGRFGPARSNARAVLLRLLGTAVRTARSESIDVEKGAAANVVLAGGEALAASMVVCGAHPLRALTELVDPGWLDPQLVRALRNVRARGVAARVTLTLENPVEFDSFTLAPSLDMIERAYDDWKYRRVSANPVLSARAGVREGLHVVEVDVQYVPHDLSWDEQAHARAAIAEAVTRALGDKLRGRIANTVVHLPQDLETISGFPQGQPNHAELALDQILWMRPTPDLAGYSTPIRGLFLCGPAMHPGIPAVTGMSAAKVAANDLKRRA